MCTNEGRISSDCMRCESVTCDSVSVNINSLHVLRIKYELSWSRGRPRNIKSTWTTSVFYPTATDIYFEFSFTFHFSEILKFQWKLQYIYFKIGYTRRGKLYHFIKNHRYIPKKTPKYLCYATFFSLCKEVLVT